MKYNQILSKFGSSCSAGVFPISKSNLSEKPLSLEACSLHSAQRHCETRENRHIRLDGSITMNDVLSPKHVVPRILLNFPHDFPTHSIRTVYRVLRIASTTPNDLERVRKRLRASTIKILTIASTTPNDLERVRNSTRISAHGRIRPIL